MMSTTPRPWSPQEDAGHPLGGPASSLDFDLVIEELDDLATAGFATTCTCISAYSGHAQSAAIAG
jgi:hypothetical protein